MIANLRQTARPGGETWQKVVVVVLKSCYIESMQDVSDVSNLQDLELWVDSFIPNLGPRDLLLLQGPMGIGKSQLVQILVYKILGEQSFSPTYAIHNRYSNDSGSIDHLDLYRVEDEEDLESTGFWDLFLQERGLICIEWADRLDEQALPQTWAQHRLRWTSPEPQQRLLHYQGPVAAEKSSDSRL